MKTPRLSQTNDPGPSVELRWTAVPSQYRPGAPKPNQYFLSIVVIPRIVVPSGDAANLDMFAWLLDWPTRIAKAVPQLGIHVHAVAPVASAPFICDRLVLSQQLWDELFRVNARAARLEDRVKPMRARSDVTVRSLNEAELMRRYVEELRADCLGQSAASRANAERARQIRVAETNMLGQIEKTSSTPSSDPTRERRAIKDFNSVVSGLLKHTPLARAFGFVIDGHFDCLLPPKQVTGVSVIPPLLAGETPICPVTKCEGLEAHFVPRRRSGETLPDLFGALTASYRFHLDSQLTTVSEIDPVGTAYVRSTLRRDVPRTRTDHTLVANPHVSAWLDNRAQWSRGRAGPAPELFADDLVKGFCVDISEKARKPTWRSLCKRRVRYRVMEKAHPNLPRTKVAGTQYPGAEVEYEACAEISAVGNSERSELYASDIFLRLDYWSLVCPRPFEAYEGDAPVPDPGIIDLVVNKAPKGSVQRVLWGQTYRLRARAQDIAGNDMTVQFGSDEGDEDAPDHRPPPHILEFDVARATNVPPPVVGYLSVPTAGIPQSAATRVIVGLATRAPDGKISIAPGDGGVRGIAPPQGSFQQAELDGRTVDLGAEDVLALIGRRDVAAREKDVVMGTAKYLPDPHAMGIVVLGASGTDSVRRAVFEGDWPEIETIALRAVGVTRPDPALERTITEALLRGRAIAEGEWPQLLGQAKAPRATLRGIEVDVPLGGPAKIAIRSDIAQVSLKKFRRITEARQQGASAEALEQAAVALTPATDVEFLVPTAFPLVAPRLTQWLGSISREGAPLVERSLDDTSVAVAFEYRAHEPTTGRVEVLARWSDRLGHPEKGDTYFAPAKDMLVLEQIVPATVAPRAQSVRIPDFPSGQITGRHHFGDTKHRKVTYSMRATTRFVEFFAPKVVSDQRASSPAESDLTISIPASHAPSAVDVDYMIPTFRQVATPGGGEVRQLTGVRIYLAGDWWSSGDEEQLAILAAPSDRTAPGRRALQVSRWANDPIRTVRLTTADHEIVFDHKKDGATLPGAARKTFVPGFVLRDGADQGLAADLHAYPVLWDDIERRWYADVDIEIEEAYLPHVELVLARYQASAILGAELSVRGTAGFVQLSPQRTVTMVENHVGLKVTVAGPTSLSVTMRCALFAGGSGPETIPTKESDFDDPLGRGGHPPEEVEKPRTLQDPWVFQFHIHPKRNSRLVVWETERLRSVPTGSGQAGDDAEAEMNVSFVSVQIAP